MMMLMLITLTQMASEHTASTMDNPPPPLPPIDMLNAEPEHNAVKLNKVAAAKTVSDAS